MHSIITLVTPMSSVPRCLLAFRNFTPSVWRCHTESQSQCWLFSSLPPNPGVNPHPDSSPNPNRSVNSAMELLLLNMRLEGFKWHNTFFFSSPFPLWKVPPSNPVLLQWPSSIKLSSYWDYSVWEGMQDFEEGTNLPKWLLGHKPPQAALQNSDCTSQMQWQYDHDLVEYLSSHSRGVNAVFRVGAHSDRREHGNSSSKGLRTV